MAEEMYKQQGAAGAAGAQPGSDAGAAGSEAGSSSDSSKFNKGTADDVDFEVHDDK